jgi:hypothetical protein
VVLSLKNLSFCLQAIDSTTTKTITLAKKQNKALAISSYSPPNEQCRERLPKDGQTLWT